MKTLTKTLLISYSIFTILCFTCLIVELFTTKNQTIIKFSLLEGIAFLLISVLTYKNYKQL